MGNQGAVMKASFYTLPPCAFGFALALDFYLTPEISVRGTVDDRNPALP